MITPNSLLAVMPAASSRAASSSASRSTTWLSRPMRRASSAGTRRPVSISSAAIVGPTMRGSQ